MIVAGTGHRPDKLGGYDSATTNRLHTLALEYLAFTRPAKVISGMALGWDQALAWAAMDLAIPFIAAVPFEGQQRAWPEVSQLWYDDLIKYADEIVYVCEPGYAAWKMQVRNQWMVDNADFVVALWDGSAGGTGNCIKYCEKVGKPIDNLWRTYNGE